VTDSLFDENTSPFGGGAGDIRSALVRFTRCTFRDNETMGSTASGGALAIYSYLEGGGAFDCDFVNNAASFEGGAIDLGATRERSWTISGCSFVSNLADRGGAIYMDTAEGVQVEDCLFDTNTGGGVYMRGGSAVSFRRSRFTNNTLQGSGAGAYVERSPVLFEKCLFDGNMCSSPGAGVYSLDAAVTVKWCEFRNNGDRQGAFHGRGTNDTPVLIGCYVHDNESGGLQFENGSNPIVQDCMIVNNSFGLWVGQFAAATVIANTTIAGNAPSFSEPGGGLTVWSGALDLRNSLVSRNTPGLQDIRIGSGVVADVAYTLVRDGQAGIENLGGTLNWLEGNLDAPPRFVDFQAGDFHLASDSPCIDGGDPALGPGTGRTDFEGQLRIWDGDGDGTSRVDMGADEFGAPSLGDLNCDGEINAFDIEPFILALTDPGSYGLAYPGCDHRAADVNRDGAVDAFDVEPFIGRLLEP
jgi:hypothetical protein